MNRFLEHINFVRKNSPFYTKLYENVPPNCTEIAQYPIVDQQKFWQANENFGQGVLTEKHNNGIVFKSGGTSGNPKYSYFSAKEWDHFAQVSGHGFIKNGVKKGDRIANLFYAGELYASFIYVSDLIKSADIGVSYPIGGQTDIAEIVALLNKLNINVLAGVPTTIMNIVSYIQEHPQLKPNIELILFGGESFYDDQLKAISQCFNNVSANVSAKSSVKVRVNSILYASVDGGELGYFDASNCENGEHRVFDESTIMEIIDEETHEVIEQENKGGKLLVSNLNRKLMPLIRYPVGDMAMWCEPQGTKNRKFKLLGRSEEGARIGPATLYIQDIIDILEHFHNQVQILNFQLLVSHDNQKDRANIKLVAQTLPEDSDNLADQIIQHLYNERTMFKELLENNIIHPISLQWCKLDELETNARTGKSKHIIDKRLEQQQGRH